MKHQRDSHHMVNCRPTPARDCMLSKLPNPQAIAEIMHPLCGMSIFRGGSTLVCKKASGADAIADCALYLPSAAEQVAADAVARGQYCASACVQLCPNSASLRCYHQACSAPLDIYTNADATIETLLGTHCHAIARIAAARQGIYLGLVKTLSPGRGVSRELPEPPRQRRTGTRGWPGRSWPTSNPREASRLPKSPGRISR
jgi:hypothetical protein